MVNRWSLRSFLIMASDEVLRISAGRAFPRVGAVTLKALS